MAASRPLVCHFQHSALAIEVLTKKPLEPKSKVKPKKNLSRTSAHTMEFLVLHAATPHQATTGSHNRSRRPCAHTEEHHLCRLKQTKATRNVKKLKFLFKLVVVVRIRMENAHIIQKTAESTSYPKEWRKKKAHIIRTFGAYGQEKMFVLSKVCDLTLYNQQRFRYGAKERGGSRRVAAVDQESVKVWYRVLLTCSKSWK